MFVEKTRHTSFKMTNRKLFHNISCSCATSRAVVSMGGAFLTNHPDKLTGMSIFLVLYRYVNIPSKWPHCLVHNGICKVKVCSEIDTYM